MSVITRSISVFFLLGISFAQAAEKAPVFQLEFESELKSPLTPHGNIRQKQSGPRPPEFPEMDKKNLSIGVDTGTYLSIQDPGENSKFDFTNGDEITAEAWVNPTALKNGEPRYIIGKGRTGAPGFPRDNQNWAFRITGQDNEAKVNFLFATKNTGDGKHWHRWTSKNGFPVNTGWHHIAITYRFGEPKSIRGWVNGKPTDGVWDMGGPTKEAPVVDDDAIWIGNRFEGNLDGIALHRSIVDETTLASRFKRVGERRVVELQEEAMPELGEIPADRVLMQLSENLPSSSRWLFEGEDWPAESTRWLSNSFLLPRIPLQFDSWGIRKGWNAPLLLRIAADVELPSGEHQFLVRARGMGRLWVDGKLVARTKPDVGAPPNGEERIIPVAEPPVEGARLPGYRQQEVISNHQVTSSASDNGSAKQQLTRVVFEVVVGGKSRRTEIGEICVAILDKNQNSYQILGANQNRIPLVDTAVEEALAEIQQELGSLDDQRRRTAASSQNEFWNKRHQLARNWLNSNTQEVPKTNQNESQHPIDIFIQEKIDLALKASAESNAEETEHFHNEVLPILRENCFRCHGQKEKGGLRLNTREAALLGGDSEVAAIVPGDLEASELIARIREKEEGLRMPPTADGLNDEEIKILEDWVKSGAAWPNPPIKKEDVALAPVIDDSAFLRRVYLDTIGTPATVEELQAFQESIKGQHASPKEQRRILIQQLVNDDRFADHWMGFWLDLLAENPSLLNASLNSTGPFRWFIYDSLRDHKPIDRMVTELLLMKGGAHEGGSAGFGLAGENDSPMAAKGHIVASAFLGVELQCARCHDSPYHSTTQQDLYALAAMLSRKSVKVPATSRVPAAFFEQQSRDSLIEVSLDPDESVKPEWPFEKFTGITDNNSIDKFTMNPKDSRERLAALITAPANERFSRVIVNHLWKRLIGSGIVEPAHDWEGNAPSHPELLTWLANDFTESGYDMRHVVATILTSNLYQQKTSGNNLEAAAELRFFNAPDRRRLTAEQIVDSLHHVTGRKIDVEELTFVHDGRRPLSNRQTLGIPKRAWMFSDIKNERDRPSLSLPKARTILDVLEAFGWNGSRQQPIHERETEPNVLQPGILANGTLSVTLTQASHQSELANLAIEAKSPEELVNTLFLRFLNRKPNSEEKTVFVAALSNGFDSRVVPDEQQVELPSYEQLPLVTWFNHLRPRANEIQVEHERRVQAGPPADPRISPQWRETYEDILWSLLNHHEFVWMP